MKEEFVMRQLAALIAVCAFSIGTVAADPLGSAFTYQGQLADSGAPANGSYDFEFSLYTSASGGSAIDTVEVDGQAVSGGLVNAAIDFTDAPYTGQALWVEVAVRAAGGGSFTTLSPRQPINATPYALYAFSAPASGGTLTLPFAGTASSSGAVFSVGNTGSGGGIVATGTAGGIANAALTANSAGGIGAVITNGSTDTALLLGNNISGGTGYLLKAFVPAGEFHIDGQGNLSSPSSGSFNSTASNGVAVLGTSANGYGVKGTGDTGGLFIGSAWGAQILNTGSCNGPGESCTSTLLLTNSQVGDLINGETNGNFVFRVNGDGAVFANGGYNTGGADVAEYVPATEKLEPGDVVEIDTANGSAFRLTSKANCTSVAGVISTQPGLTMNTSELDAKTAGDEPRLALNGRVPVKATTENGAIRPGDLLVASSTAGRAMRAPVNPRAGTVIGKAMQPLDRGSGEIEMLVMLR
jgi:hypothetical protein